MKALTIQQPWASAIIQGIKDVENRTWYTHYTGPLVIHAGKTAWFEPIPQKLIRKYLQSLMPLGFILGIVDLVECVDRKYYLTDNPFASGPICWIIKNPRPLKNPIPWRGQQGLWNVPDEVVKELI